MPEQFRDAGLARRVVGVKFDPGNAELIRQVAHIPVLNNILYQESPGRWIPAPYGPLDTRLGTASKTNNCQTCGENSTDCVGHFGFINLEYPVFHVGFFKYTIQVLQCICKNCSAILLSEEQKTPLRRSVSNPNLDYLKRKAFHKKIIDMCKKNTKAACNACGYRNGIVKKAVGGVLKIAHEEPINDSTYQSFMNAAENNAELSTILGKTKFTNLNPLAVQKLFNAVKVEDIPLLMVRAGEVKHPNDLLLTRMAVPPVCIRPSVVSEVKSGTTEDDITMKLAEIMVYNDVLRKHKKDGFPSKTVNETWEHLQIQCALYINSELSGLPADFQKKSIRGLTQRLKGKQGRFRGNLSGKRVDFTGRTVISPDPNLRIDQVGVPVHVAKIMTFPEIVNGHNIERMRKLIINGSNIHPGANYLLEKKTGIRKLLMYGKRENFAASLKAGDIVERHLDDNDIVLFNRQPSLHKISIMCHRAKIMAGRTFRFNECACTPYNADFDGDEMNLHLPQTYEAKAEASLLMGVKSNLITPRSGEPLIAAIQDFITGGYLMTHKDTFFPKSEIHRFAAAIIDCNAKTQTKIQIPPPAILKPVKLWTGKQLAELIIRPDADSPIKLNLSTKNKSYSKENEEFCINDSFVIIRNSVLLAGCLDKSLLGSSSKTNIFYMLLRDFGEDAAVDAMWRLGRMASVFLSNRGFSIGIGDVHPSDQLLKEKSRLVNDGYKKCNEFIEQLKVGKLKTQPGCTEEETLEALVLKELSSIRDDAFQVCKRNLSKYNSPLTMAVCGSKGSFINISQMIACVGQQAISGHRPPDGFDERSLPHFYRKEKTPEAKGFVANSFYSGLTPTEFFFHTMGGREGLIDTAVKTAETGYMQRRLVKCLEDLCVNYDNTVRSSTGEIVEFIFGEDGLDPAAMEAKDVVDFNHVMEHIRNTIPNETHEVVDQKIITEVVLKTVENCLHNDHPYFRTQLEDYIRVVLEGNAKILALRSNCFNHSSYEMGCRDCESVKDVRTMMIKYKSLSVKQAVGFIELCNTKLRRAITEPGTAVGAIAATSIGEPSTQMTLKTFHFAGVASMNITQGVPRIREIINAVKNISTPIITAQITDSKDERLARRVKARIEKTTLGEICDYIEEVYQPTEHYLLIKLNAKRIRLLQLEITMASIAHSITTTKSLVKITGDQIRFHGRTMMTVRPPLSSKLSPTMTMSYLKYNLGNVVIKGISNVSRCVIHADEQKGEEYSLLVEGTDFLSVLSQMGIEGRKTKFNNALVVAEVLGIEAARTCIITEILATMEAHGIGLDRRHVMLLADLMTYRGEVLGIQRNGMVKMKESVLLLASFEKTMDHLYDAAFFSQRDKIHGVSECIIMGTPITIGTGLFKLLHKREPPVISCKTPIFSLPEFNLKI